MAAEHDLQRKLRLKAADEMAEDPSAACHAETVAPFHTPRFARLGKPRRMKEAERPARVRASEIGPDVEQELGEVPVFGEVRPQRADGTMVARPEGTGLTRTALGTSQRVCELAESWLHAPSLAPAPTRAIRGGAGIVAA